MMSTDYLAGMSLSVKRVSHLNLKAKRAIETAPRQIIRRILGFFMHGKQN
jgi:hypothetical protein